MRVAVAGCGNVSDAYLADLKSSPHVELVAVCDHRIERARQQAERYAVAECFDDVDRMLGRARFELFVNLTPMPLHASFNRKALQAGRHVWCEKPFAGSAREAHELLALARERGVGLWGAPNTPASPAFGCMRQVLASGEIGRARAAHGIYGHGGPSWGPWFYQQGGGSLFDLGVYNLTTLTGLLGPARAVVAMSAVAVPQRLLEGQSVTVEADDNIAVVVDHGDAVLSVVQSGFVYGAQREEWTVQIVGERGAMTMNGYDWQPAGVAVCAGEGAHAGGATQWEVRCRDSDGYAWQGGASYVAACLDTGQTPVLRGEHAAHVIEVMEAALQSARSGRRVALESSFAWPLAG